MTSVQASATCLPLLQVVSLLLTAFANAVEAQQGPPETTPEVLVTGSRLPITPNGLAQSVSTIDSRQIQQFDPGRLEDALSQVSSVYVDSAGTGGFSSLYLRGAENSHLLLLIDGVKVNDPTSTRGSAYDLSAIDVGQIESIEILRGPASAIHGGEALAGVINIITRPASGSGFRGSAYGSAGQEGFARAGGTVSASNQAWASQLGVGTSRDGESGDDASLRLNTLSGYMRFSPTTMLGSEIFVRHTDRESVAFPDDSGGPRLAVNRELTTRDARDTVYGANIAWGNWRSPSIKVGVSVYERDEFADNPFIDAGVRFPVPAFTSDTHFRRTTAHLTATRKLRESILLVAGIEHQAEEGSLVSVGDFQFDGDPITLNYALQRDTDSVYAEGQFQLAPPVSLQIGMRRDKVEGLSAETTPNLGIAWTLPHSATTLKASYSEGFKPPSFFALGFPIGANPDLKPETSSNVEFTLVQRIGDSGSSAQVGLFHTDYLDLVDFDSTTFTYVNRGKIVVTGIEPSVSHRLNPKLRLQVGLTLLDISERDGLAPLRNRPERRYTANAAYDMNDRSSLFAALSYSAGFIDRSNPTGDIRMPGFETVNAGYSLRAGPLLLKFSIDNLFDADFEQFVGFQAQGRRLRVQLQGEYK
jgi:iron complex outermembrane receptor protein/vitamin B12 transporter